MHRCSQFYRLSVFLVLVTFTAAHGQVSPPSGWEGSQAQTIYLPTPIVAEDIQRWSNRLLAAGLSEDEVDDAMRPLYKQYSGCIESLEPELEELTQEYQKYSFMRDTQLHEQVDVITEIVKMRDAFVSKVRSCETVMFAQLAAAFEDHEVDIAETLHYIRLDRQRKFYDRAFSVAKISRARVDLLEELRRVLPEEEWTEEVREVEYMYLMRIVPPAKKAVETLVELLYKDRAVIAEYAVITDDGFYVETPPEFQEKRQRMAKPMIRAYKTIASANEEFLIRFENVLPDNDGKELRDRYNVKAFNQIYPYAGNPINYLELIFNSIDDLTEEQKEALEALYKTCTLSYRKANRALEVEIGRWEELLAESGPIHIDTKAEHERKMRELRVARQSVAVDCMTQMRELLTPEQLAAFDRANPMGRVDRSPGPKSDDEDDADDSTDEETPD